MTEKEKEENAAVSLASFDAEARGEYGEIVADLNGRTPLSLRDGPQSGTTHFSEKRFF